MSLIVLFHLTFTFIFLAKKFQFQQNKRILNEHLICSNPQIQGTTRLTNWYCNGCDQWHEAYKNARDIIKFTTWELQRYITNHKNLFNIHLIVCWSPSIIFIVTSNYKSCVVKFIVFLTFYYLNYLWLVIRLFLRPII